MRYAVKPSPREGRLEMTAAFFKRKKFFSEKSKLGELISCHMSWDGVNGRGHGG